jgi:hypothetical protein
MLTGSQKSLQCAKCPHTHTHTHAYTHMYIFTCVYIYICSDRLRVAPFVLCLEIGRRGACQFISRYLDTQTGGYHLRSPILSYGDKKYHQKLASLLQYLLTMYSTLLMRLF